MDPKIEDMLKAFQEGKMPDFDPAALGIPKEALDSLGPNALKIVGKMVDEFNRGAPFYADEEKRLKDSRHSALTELSGLLVQNISSVRALLLAVVTFSLTVIGIVVSVIKTNDKIFASHLLPYAGTIILAFAAIASIIYLLHKEVRENDGLYKRFKIHKDMSKELLDLMGDHYKTRKSFDDYLAAKNLVVEKYSKMEDDLNSREIARGKDWMPHVVVYAFISGLILVGLGIFF